VVNRHKVRMTKAFPVSASIKEITGTVLVGLSSYSRVGRDNGVY
jgi:hypothetical protein